VALHAQISKSQLKPANYPANLAVQKAKVLLGNKSPYLLHEDTRAQFHQRLNTFTTQEQVLDYIERILNKWGDFLREEKHYQRFLKNTNQDEEREEQLQQKELRKVNKEIQQET